ncbi:MAG: hypothetical protein RIA65_06820, partial [Woeseia sp.]
MLNNRKLVRALCPGLAAIALISGCQPAAEPFLPQYDAIDVLIEDAQVIDGSGTAAVAADVVVVGNSIVFVGDAGFAEKDPRIVRRIDAAGRVLAPGFIDLHSHGDPLETPEMENFLAMGVTTISLGQDGSSPDVEELSVWLTEVDQKRMGTNLAMFIGHGTLRDRAGVGRNPWPEPEQMARMLKVLEAAMPHTFGMTTGLEYNPGLNAGEEELVVLAQVVGKYDRLIMSHMRNED